MPLSPLRNATIVVLVVIANTARAAPPPTEAVAFFEANVRPVLIEHCLKCHGPEKQESGLRLDSRAAALKGGNTGPAIDLADPDGSTILLAIEHEDDLLKMPPEEKLPDPEVEAITAWVRMGAPWPEEPSATVQAGADPEAKHWAFEPVRAVGPPEVRDPSWVATPVDAFILARLEAEGLTPSPSVDRRTLIRRASFDLLGLPPTPEEVDAFVADTEADAYPKLIDRLLASPRYGERWGRHWLDVARYADTKGYVFQEERRYPYSYTYRDYVIGAFNADLPFDRFIVQQVAADSLPEAKRTPGLQAALGFLTLGRRFLNNQQDIIDDRIDVVSRGLLGLTVACARCHDHKYDPIPTEDYYSLYGIFNSSTEPDDLPLIGEPPAGPEADDYRKQVAERQVAYDAMLESFRDQARGELRSKVGAYLGAADDLEFNPRHADFDARTRADDLKPELLRGFMESWKGLLARTRQAPDSVLAPWHAFAALPADEFAAQAEVVADRFRADDEASPARRAAEAVALPAPDSLRTLVDRYGQILARSLESPGSEADPALDAVRNLIEAADGPFAFLDGDLESGRLLNKADRNKLRDLRKKIDALVVSHPGAPPRAMVLVDRPEPIEPRVLLRGNVGRPGKEVPRRFLAALSGPERTPFRQGSGRLELAQAIASPTNPLTARVMVNRVWMHHFGEGLVRTPSDFGLRSEPPSHPELLDHLAARFVAGGWSVKDLHRVIMLSNAYRQRSEPRPEGLEVDPENRLLWRQDRRRLEFEALRDALLAASGRLDPTMGGRSVSISRTPFTNRRTVYGFIDRSDLEGVFRAFDLASPEASSPKRFETTVPQQALYLMNGPFVIEQVRQLAARADREAGGNDLEGHVRALHRRLFAREPSPDEIALAARFLEHRAESGDDEAPAKGRLSPWESYTQVLLLTNEFLFVD